MNFEAFLRSEKFKQALIAVLTEENERYAQNTWPVTFSPRFERKMDRLIQAQKHSYYPMINRGYKKALLAVAISLVLLITMVFSVSAIRKPVIQFIVKTYEKFSQIFYHQEEEEGADEPLDSIETYYAPTWLPEGYMLDEDRSVEMIVSLKIRYVNALGHEITFKQTTAAAIKQIDTEGIAAVPTTVNGNPGLSYENKGIQNLIWNDGQYNFQINGPVKEEDLMRVAESISVTYA